MEDFQSRLNRCFAKCQDEATDTIGVEKPDQAKAEVRTSAVAPRAAAGGERRESPVLLAPPGYDTRIGRRLLPACAVMHTQLPSNVQRVATRGLMMPHAA